MIVGIIIIVVQVGFASWAMWFILKSHEQIVEEHSAVKKQLLDSDTKEAFIAGWQRAIDWQKTCWHKNHNALAMELKGIIDVKKEIYNL